MRCAAHWRRSTKPRAWIGCRRISITACRHCCKSPGSLDADTTIKPLYGTQEGAVVGYNPHKPGRPSHCYHTYMMSTPRLVLSVDVQAGDQHNVKHASDGLWSLLDRLGQSRWPALLRGDLQWGATSR